MLKSTIIPAAAALSMAAFATAADAGTRVPNDLSQCRAGASGSAALVRVVGFRDNNGRVRVQSYQGDSNWLERGRWLHRVDIPVQSRNRNMTVCLPLPGPGTYGIAVRHDSNGNNRSDRRDGGGFSGNPDLSFPFNLEPDYDEVAFRAGAGVTRITVVLNYMQGTSVEPIG
ncbi:MAG: DUF2141 domain-containing protein [Parasphingopyxis sp.]|uniref:DUF2141 domain-containing protein n=1 Tax=Parasphingopyxis sp. TaxID=1920299 RepID=UPI003FA10950